MCVGQRQLMEVGSLLPCGPQELNSDHQGWRQAPLSVESSHWPRELITPSIFYLHIVYLLLTFSLTLAFGLRAGAQVQRPRRTSHWASHACSSHPYILIKVILVYLMLEGSCCLVVNYTFFFIIFCSKLLLVLRKTTTFYLFILNPVTFYWML